MRDRAERRHRRTVRHPDSINLMAGANFGAVPSLSEAMGLIMNPLTDPECQQFLTDLRALEQRATALSNRLDREYGAVGKLWDVRQSLTHALERAETELSE